MGLNKSMTFGEFFEKNKGLYPPRIQKMLEPLVAKFKNEPMPSIEIAETKNSLGETVPAMRLSNGVC